MTGTVEVPPLSEEHYGAARLIVALLGEPCPPIIALAISKANSGCNRKLYHPSPVSEMDVSYLVRCHITGQPIGPRTCIRKDGTSWVEAREPYGLGAYCLRRRGEKQMCGWIAIDIDGADHIQGQADIMALEITVAVAAMMEQAGLKPLIERSHGGHGFHVWSIFEVEQEAEFSYWLAALIMAEMQRVSPRATMEAFPKQSQAELGSLVGLPLAGAAPGQGGGKLLWPDGSEREAETFEIVPKEALEPLKEQWQAVSIARHQLLAVQKDSMASLPPRIPATSRGHCSALDRCRAFMKKVPGAVSDGSGHHETFKVATVGGDFGLSEDQFWPLLLEWNYGCHPPWDKEKLHVVLMDAGKHRQKPVGWRIAQ